MSNSLSPNLLGIARNSHTLENALGRNRNGVGAVAKHIAVDHISKTLGIILLCHVQSHILYRAQLVGVLFIGFQLFGAETAGIGASGIDLVTLLTCKVHNSVRGIETSAECYNNFLL